MAKNKTITGPLAVVSTKLAAVLMDASMIVKTPDDVESLVMVVTSGLTGIYLGPAMQTEKPIIVARDRLDEFSELVFRATTRVHNAMLEAVAEQQKADAGRN